MRSARDRPAGSTTASREMTEMSPVATVVTALLSHPTPLPLAKEKTMLRIRPALAAVAVAALAAIPAAQAIQTAQASTTLKGVVGPGFTITLTSGGKKVTKLKAGTYGIKVSDKSNIHDFHLSGPGVNKPTTVPGTGGKTWTVKLKRGKHTYVCDAHASSVKGSFTVT